MRKYLATLAVVLLAAFALGACGGDDDKDAVTAGTNTSQDDNSSDDNSSDDNSSDDSTDDSSSDDDSGDGDIDFTKCKALSEEFANAAAAAGQAFSGGGDTEESLEKLDDAVDAAPSEIRDDLEVVVGALRDYVKAIEDSGYDPASGKQPTAEQAEALQELSTTFDDQKYSDASDRLEQYFTDKCS